MLGNIVTAPDSLDVIDDEFFDFPTVFLAGGITNCPDWQKPTAQRIAEELEFWVLNPRRQGVLDFRDAKSANEQILWEHHALKMSDTKLFWFPAEGMCMITLFELGRELGQFNDIRIGVHPDYIRKLDVEVQSRLMGHRTIYYDLDAMITDFIEDNK